MAGLRLATIPIALVLFAQAQAVYPAPLHKPEIHDIRGQVRGREARVLFSIRNAFTPEMVEALKSGIEISFRVEVRVERVYRNWFDRTVGAARFSRSVRYDVLSRVWHLNRGRGEEAVPDIFAALAGMTHHDVVVPLLEDAEPGKRYRAYVRCRLDRVGLSEPLRSILFFSSLWDVETGWERGALEAP